jgi:hypothetical protein
MKDFRLVYLCLLLLITTEMIGQSVPDTIGYSTGKGELKFYYKGHEAKFLDISKILLADEMAAPYAKKARLYRNLNGVFLGIGIISLSYGVLFGLKEAIEENESSNVYSGLIAGTVVGGVFIALSIPPVKSYKTNARKAIDLYNEGWRKGSENGFKIESGITSDGLTLRLKF